MSLKSKIEQSMKDAMKQKNQDDLRALRAIKSMILLAASEKGAGAELNETEEIDILSKAVKQRKDSLAVYEQQNREDLAEKERVEIAVIERFLPKQLGDDELEEELRKIVQEVGAEGPKDMGKVMGKANQSLKGKADGKKIAETVKRLLNP